MNLQLKRNVMQEAVILLVFILAILLSNLIYFGFTVGVSKLNNYLHDTILPMQLIPAFTFFYPISILIRRGFKRPILTGFIAFFNGVLSLLWAGLVYVFANMDYIGIFHAFVAFLSPILALIGIVYIIFGFVKCIIRNSSS